MTKFIEGAREIEMDAVAKNGKVCGMCCFKFLNKRTIPLELLSRFPIVV